MAAGAIITTSVLAQSDQAIHAITSQLINTAHLMDVLSRCCTSSSTTYWIRHIETSLITWIYSIVAWHVWAPGQSQRCTRGNNLQVRVILPALLISSTGQFVFAEVRRFQLKHRAMVPVYFMTRNRKIPRPRLVLCDISFHSEQRLPLHIKFHDRSNFLVHGLYSVRQMFQEKICVSAFSCGYCRTFATDLRDLKGVGWPSSWPAPRLWNEAHRFRVLKMECNISQFSFYKYSIVLLRADILL